MPPSGVADIDYVLKAGRLAITPGTISKTVGWGASATQKVTAKNTGTAPATLTVGEQAGGFTIQGIVNAPTQIVPAQVSTGDAVKAAKAAGVRPASMTPAAATTGGDAWQPLANFPTTIQDDIAEVYQGKLYAGFGYDGTADSNALSVYDPTAGTWSSLAASNDTRESPAHGFIGGKLYVVGGWGPDGRVPPSEASRWQWTR